VALPGEPHPQRLDLESETRQIVATLSVTRRKVKQFQAPSSAFLRQIDFTSAALSPKASISDSQFTAHEPRISAPRPLPPDRESPVIKVTTCRVEVMEDNEIFQPLIRPGGNDRFTFHCGSPIRPLGLGAINSTILSNAEPPNDDRTHADCCCQKRSSNRAAPDKEAGNNAHCENADRDKNQHFGR
jgi:hypothetical protein